MRIVSTGTAFPAYYYPQREIASAIGQMWSNSLEDKVAFERFHRAVGVSGRHLSQPLARFEQVETFGTYNNTFIEVAEELGEQAINNALHSIGLCADQIGALFFVSITGIANPSVDARLMNRLPFSRHLRRTPIFGLGCAGGAAGISRAADYVLAHPLELALLLSVELCSLTWQRKDFSTANLISTALFGDGAAAVILAGDETKLTGPKIIATESIFYPNTEELMGWDISEDGLRVVLSPDVPKICLEHLGADVDRFLAKHNLLRSDIGQWIMHTGGPRVLEAMAQSLALPREAFKHSWNCLRELGNLSSAAVLVVLDEIMKNDRPAPGTLSILAAMGPGFCAELVLIRW